MSGAGEDSALPSSMTGEKVRAPLLDRLVARVELHPIFGQPLAVSTALALATMWPAMITMLPGRQAPAAALALLLAGLAALAWVVEGSRFVWRVRNPQASTRWLHAVRAVAGDDVMAYAVAGLMAWRTRDRDYVIIRRDVIEQVGAERRRRREALTRAHGVRIDRPAA